MVQSKCRTKTEACRTKQFYRSSFRIWSIKMDLFFIKDIPEQKSTVGMLMIDVFDKFMHVVPIQGKKEEDLASGMIECLHKMGKKPEIMYTDDETALSTEAIQKYLEDENIEHHRTRAHPNFSERAIRTFKDMLYRRVEADEKKGKPNHPMARLHSRNIINL